VLLVDDQPELRRFFARYLARAGFETLEAGDGATALTLAQRHHIDAVLSDVRMPRMDGLQLLDALLELDPDLPVVLMSATDDVADTQREQSKRAFCFLSKPVDTVLLVSAITRAVEQRIGSRSAKDAVG
jgi:DNA-binding NtrC family response regulator